MITVTTSPPQIHLRLFIYNWFNILKQLKLSGVEAEPEGGAVAALTEGEVAAESSGRIPPQAMMMLSTI